MVVRPACRGALRVEWRRLCRPGRLMTVWREIAPLWWRSLWLAVCSRCALRSLRSRRARPGVDAWRRWLVWLRVRRLGVAWLRWVRVLAWPRQQLVAGRWRMRGLLRPGLLLPMLPLVRVGGSVALLPWRWATAGAVLLPMARWAFPALLVQRQPELHRMGRRPGGVPRRLGVEPLFSGFPESAAPLVRLRVGLARTGCLCGLVAVLRWRLLWLTDRNWCARRTLHLPSARPGGVGTGRRMWVLGSWGLVALLCWRWFGLTDCNWCAGRTLLLPRARPGVLGTGWRLWVLGW